MPIRSFVEACKKLKIDPKKALPKVETIPKALQKPILGYAKLAIIAKALNDGWEPDWDNTNEWKYFPWFWMNKPGFRFYVSCYVISCTDSPSGSRLCLFSESDAEFFAQECIALWSDFMGGKLPK